MDDAQRKSSQRFICWTSSASAASATSTTASSSCFAVMVAFGPRFAPILFSRGDASSSSSACNTHLPIASTRSGLTALPNCVYCLGPSKM